MSWLSGAKITGEVLKKHIVIDPFHPNQINPNSYDYRLSPILKRVLPNSHLGATPVIDPRVLTKYESIYIPDTGYLLEPHQAYLGSTVEKFGSNKYASLVTGKSSVGRLFIQNHCCAGLIDQGFFGSITLEITVTHPVLIFPEMRFGQIYWYRVFGDPLLYSGKYQSQSEGLVSQIYKDIYK